MPPQQRLRLLDSDSETNHTRAIFPFAFIPSSTRRRMASERETPCFLAHASSDFIDSISNRAGMVPAYFTPVGLPLDFLNTVLSCFGMIIRIHEKRAGWKL
jgi:hypothetical protein